MKRDISKIIVLSFITIISVSIVFLSRKIKKTENVFSFFIKRIRIKYKKISFNFFIPYMKNKNDKIENELGI